MENGTEQRSFPTNLVSNKIFHKNVADVPVVYTPFELTSNSIPSIPPLPPAIRQNAHHGGLRVFPPKNPGFAEMKRIVCQDRCRPTLTELKKEDFVPQILER
ncbi:hypothetical protein CHS0354_020350 [Potamilus streckersoni]|uniref:Uncharacterized protein n=1 Tax=Potamilus streckersoni TaxID=2493646 RepID=A0AAE0SFA8_9BIVA|nr:hypothetical protein CHS0354_020350 [Potamilus streckersoni]